MTNPADLPWLRYLRTEARARLRAQHSTQESLAACLGVGPKHMSQVLSGAVTGSPELLDRIADAVGLRITVTDAGRDPVPLSRDQRGRRSGRRKAGAPPGEAGR